MGDSIHEMLYEKLQESEAKAEALAEALEKIADAPHNHDVGLIAELALARYRPMNEEVEDGITAGA